MRHFLDLLDLSASDIQELLEDAKRLKLAQQSGERSPELLGQVLGLVFEKPSLRTRVSFQSAMAQLGGTSLFLSGNEAGLGTRESIPDFARVMSQYVDAIVLRTFRHATVEEFAAHANCPVINGLSDIGHPCQALADLFTIQEVFGGLQGRTVAFVGDGNNVARSLAVACGKLGVRFILAAPEGFGFDEEFVRTYSGRIAAGLFVRNGKPEHAVSQADIIYTDVWTSMGQEAQREKRNRSFASYQVNDAMLALAPAHARVMHCLPAHRGEEITDDVLDGTRCIAFQQAGNRLHVQKALLVWLLGKPKQNRA
jgi:ornithine carbamoyltransferase